MLILSICTFLLIIAEVTWNIWENRRQEERYAKAIDNLEISIRDQLKLLKISSESSLIQQFKVRSTLLNTELNGINHGLDSLVDVLAALATQPPCTFNESVKGSDPSKIHVVPFPPIPAGRENHQILQFGTDGLWHPHSFRAAAHPDIKTFEETDGFCVVYPDGTVVGKN